MAERSTRRKGRNDSAADKGQSKRAKASTRGARMQRAHCQGKKSLGQIGAVEIGREYEVSEATSMRHQDARFLTLPTLNIIALITFAVVVTNAVTGYRYDVEKNITELRINITAINENVAGLSKSIAEKDLQRWQRLDQRLWCKETEDVNREAGWKCGPTTFDR